MRKLTNLLIGAFLIGVVIFIYSGDKEESRRREEIHRAVIETFKFECGDWYEINRTNGANGELVYFNGCTWDQAFDKGSRYGLNKTIVGYYQNGDVLIWHKGIFCRTNFDNGKEIK